MSAYRTLPLSRREAASGGQTSLSAPRAHHGGSAPSSDKPGVTTGFIHSVESFGTLDGPGIRYVIFFQGCHLRCLFCQNRDTWAKRTGRETTVDGLMEEIRRYKGYMKSSGGGLTASGGDPILQPRFVTELFRAARGEGIHTALDTSGVTALSPAVEELIEATDLVLLDIKQIDSRKHRLLTGHGNERVLAFARRLAGINKRVWIRHVIIPGFTDNQESARRTAAFLAELGNVDRVDLLPYHEFGAHKWEALGDAYPLEGVEPPAASVVAELADLFREAGLTVGETS